MEVMTMPATTGTAIRTAELTDSMRSRFMAYVDARDATLKAYGNGLRRFYAWLADSGIATPCRADILAYRDHLRAVYAPATVSLYLTAVRLFFQWTQDAGLYPDIAGHIKGAKLSRAHRKGYFTSGAMHSIIQTADTSTPTGKRDRALLALMATGGLRCVEVARANIEDLTALGDCTVLYVQGKGQDERTDFIRVAPQTEKALRDYLATRHGAKPSDPLFAASGNRNQGGRMTTRSISRICKEHFQAAGYDDRRLTAHSLRHTAATLAILGGATLLEAQEHLRHASPNTTMIYVDETNKAANTSAERIASAIF